MQTITSMEESADLKDNLIIGNFDFVSSKVIFNGKNNILMTPNLEDSERIVLNNTTIFFNNDNGVVFLNAHKAGGRYPACINIKLFGNCFCYIGRNNFFNGILNLQCAEQCNILIGDDCLFSFGIWLRTSDVHLIYDVERHKRVSNSKSVFIGDHVWVGQDAKIWKGTQIGSGAIIGANAFLGGKHIPSNTVWGGNPARLIRRGVFFLGNSANAFTDAETEKWRKYSGDEYIYTFDANETLDFIELERQITSLSTARERADFLLDFSRRKSKNRFYIGEAETGKGLTNPVRAIGRALGLLKKKGIPNCLRR